MTIPLHGKYSYVRIRNSSSSTWQVISFATNYSFDVMLQNSSRAVVMGTDGILDIQTQGILASSNISLILTDTEDAILTMLGTPTAAGQFGGNKVIDYETKIANVLAGGAFDGTIKIDLQLIPVATFLDFSGLATSGHILGAAGDNAAADNTKAVNGYVFTLKNAVLKSLSTGGGAGSYDESRLSCETGEFIIEQFTS